MNTDPKNQKNRALELWLQSRHEAIPEEAMAFVEETLSADPDASSEAEGLERMLVELSHARVPFRDSHRHALRSRLGELVREDVLEHESPSRAPWLQRLGDLVLGGREGGARPRLILARSLALGLGIVVALVIFHSRPGHTESSGRGPAGAIAEQFETKGR